MWSYDVVSLTSVINSMTDVAELRRILTENNSIAVVGLSANESRPSFFAAKYMHCLLYTSPSPRDATLSRMPSSA